MADQENEKEKKTTKMSCHVACNAVPRKLKGVRKTATHYTERKSTACFMLCEKSNYTEV